jgi:PBS lyase HEAT-like repeat
VPSQGEWREADEIARRLKKRRDVEGVVGELDRGGDRRHRALWALRRIGDPSALPALRAARRREPLHRRRPYRRAIRRIQRGSSSARP